jgi:hypothetical protein
VVALASVGVLVGEHRCQFGFGERVERAGADDNAASRSREVVGRGRWVFQHEHPVVGVGAGDEPQQKVVARAALPQLPRAAYLDGDHRRDDEQPGHDRGHVGGGQGPRGVSGQVGDELEEGRDDAPVVGGEAGAEQ